MTLTLTLTRQCILLSLAFISLFTFAQHSPPDQSHSAESFIQDALVRSYALIHSAEQAMEKSTSQEVKGYAQRINNEYSSLVGELHDLAQDKDIPIQKEELSNVADNLSLAVNEQQAFDVAYGKNQVPAISQILNLFQQATELNDDEVSQFANHHLPHIRRHLQIAEQLFAATTETRTDIYQNRQDQLDEQDTDTNRRVPTTDRISP